MRRADRVFPVGKGGWETGTSRQRRVYSMSSSRGNEFSSEHFVRSHPRPRYRGINRVFLLAWIQLNSRGEWRSRRVQTIFRLSRVLTWMLIQIIGAGLLLSTWVPPATHILVFFFRFSLNRTKDGDEGVFVAWRIEICQLWNIWRELDGELSNLKNFS